MLDKIEMRDALPKVGDRLMMTPTALTYGLGSRDTPPEPQPCTVEQVNPERLWYRVRFDAGYCECYRAPDVNSRQLYKRRNKGVVR